MDTINSDISICATALLELGSRPISDFLEDNEPARLCSSLYPHVRDEMLRLHPWNFAIKRRILLPHVDAPEFGYAYQYTLPSDFIRLMEVNGTPTVAGGVQSFMLEDGKILSNDPKLYVRFVYVNTTPAKWDAAFIRLMICAMKKALAYAITRDAAATANAMQEWAIALKQAKTANGIETPPQVITGNTFLASRY